MLLWLENGFTITYDMLNNLSKPIKKKRAAGPPGSVSLKLVTSFSAFDTTKIS